MARRRIFVRLIQFMGDQDNFSRGTRDIVALVESAVLDAASYLVGVVQSGEKIEVSVKADHSLVLNLDLESQRKILGRLKEAYPIVAEEDEASHRLIEQSSTYLLVDPLDGTTSCKRFLGQIGGQVGYGPLVGFVKDHVLTVASFYSLPHRKLFTAVKGEGCYASEIDFVQRDTPTVRKKLTAAPCHRLCEAGLLFLFGHHGESRVVQHLRNLNAVENIYRFGGFANDCARLAQGYEQLGVQFSVKPWDLSGALLAAESGLEVWLDPMAKRTILSEWRIRANNPLIITQPGMRDELFSALSTLS